MKRFKVEEFFGFVVGLIGFVIAGTIGLCLITIILSATLEIVTGFSLIQDVIRPLFGH